MKRATVLQDRRMLKFRDVLSRRASRSYIVVMATPDQFHRDAALEAVPAGIDAVRGRSLGLLPLPACGERVG